MAKEQIGELGSLMVDIDADASGLEKSLKKAESRTAKSGAAMSKNLDKVAGSTLEATQATDLLGKTAAATGNQGVAMAQIMGELALSIKGVWAAVSGPVGLIVAGVALAATFVALQFDIGGARSALFDWMEGVGDAKEKAKELDDLLKGRSGASAFEKNQKELERLKFENKLIGSSLTGKRAELARLKRSDPLFGKGAGGGANALIAQQAKNLEKQIRVDDRRAESAKRLAKLVKDKTKSEKDALKLAADKLKIDKESEAIAKNRKGAKVAEFLAMKEKAIAKVGTTVQKSISFASSRSSASFGSAAGNLGTDSDNLLVNETVTMRQAIEEMRDLMKNKQDKNTGSFAL